MCGTIPRVCLIITCPSKRSCKHRCMSLPLPIGLTNLCCYETKEPANSVEFKKFIAMYCMHRPLTRTEFTEGEANDPSRVFFTQEAEAVRNRPTGQARRN